MTDRVEQLDHLTPEEKRELVADLLRKKIDSAVDIYPLSYGQQAMWFLYQLAPESSAYNVAFTARIRSAVDCEALVRALQALILRHQPLRTTYSARGGKQAQVVHRRMKAQLSEVSVAGLDDDELYQRVIAAYREPFDLENGPALRARLFTRAADDHILLLAAHHITLDGWATWVLLDELRALYAAEVAGQPADLPKLSAQYGDFVHWQRDLVDGPTGERMWDYWRQQLGGELPTLDLPTDRPRPTVQSFNGASTELALDESVAAALRSIAASEQTTLYTALLAAFQVLLHRYSGQDDIVVGSPVAGRSRPEFAGLIGDFINTIALRGDLSGNPSFRDVLARARQTTLGALENQDYPFALLVNRLAPRHDSSRSPLFQAVFDLQRIQRIGELSDLLIPGNTDARVNLGGLTLEPYPMPQQEGQVDVLLQMVEVHNVILGSIKYNADLFDESTIERFKGHFQRLTASLVSQPDLPIDELPLLSAGEQQEILVDWNTTDAGYPMDRCVHQLIEEQVARTPSAIAVEFEGQRLTYQELNERANQLARHLVSLGAGPEEVAGIYLERSLDMFVALLAIHKAGGAYLPLDPTYPAERLRLMMDDARIAVLVTNNSVRPDHLLDSDPVAGSQVHIVNLDVDRHAIDALPSENLNQSVSSDSLAYIIHTSGSTGRPKGIEIEHRALVSFLFAFQRRPGMTPGDVVLARTTLSFDPSIVETFLPLVTGARIILVSSRVSANGEQLKRALETSQVTTLQVTPAHCRLLLAAGWQGGHKLKLLVGGEALTRDLVEQLLPRVGELWNIYGPTETTVWATAARITDPARITVGRPIDNVKIFILDSASQPTPVGVVGEVHIGGPGLARGYRGRSDLTEQSFIALDTGCWNADSGTGEAIPNRVSPIRLYRTGDLARYKHDGTIELLGRADSQVKVRGFRVELGEIETALSQLEGVAAAVVVAREDVPGNKRLIAYVQPEAGATISPGILRRSLKQRVPNYMVPSMFVPLDEFPLTQTGKVDLRALPAPEQRRTSIDERFVAPQSATEQIIGRLWSEALSIDRVGVYDNYFDLGGDSLRLVEVMAKLEDQVGVRLSPAYAQTQSLGQLAAHCDEMIAKGNVRTQEEAPRSGGVIRAMRRMFGVGSHQEVG